MSIAHKCDRCGTLYEHDFKNHGNGTLFMGRRPYNNDFLDLCPMCQKSLESWFVYSTKVKKEKPEEEK